MKRIYLIAMLVFGCGGGGAGPADAARDATEAGPEVGGSDAETIADDSAPSEPAGSDFADVESEDGASDTGPSEEVLDRIAEGKRWLRDGEPGLARHAFEQAMALAPDYPDAVFGLALSHLVYGAELAVMAVSIGGQLADPGAAPQWGLDGLRYVPLSTGTPPDTWSQNEYLAAELHYIFMNLREHFATGSDLLAQLQGRPLAFDVEAVPVSLGIKPTVIYRGVFDAADVWLMRAVADTAAGVLDTLAGQDLSTDVLTIVGLVKSGFSDVDARAIFAILAYLLNEDSRFLTLHPQDGAMLFEDARRRFEAAGQHLSRAIEALASEGASGEGVSYFEPGEGGGGVLHVCCRIVRGSDGSAHEEEMTFGLTEEILDGFRSASESIGNPGRKVTLHGAVLPILATMVSVMTQTGFLEGVGAKLPIDLSGFEIAGISGLLASLLPNVVAFDWGAFFAHPTGLRAWMPVVTHSGQGGLSDTVLAEWECPDDLVNGFPSGLLGLVCGKSAALQDQPHFVGTTYEIAADGFASPVPVFAWDDPMLNHLLFVDLDAAYMQADASTYEPATLRSLNAALARILGGLLPLIPAD